MTINSGKCPKCGTTVSKVGCEAIVIEGGTKPRRGVSYYCLSCHAVLSVEIDPYALKTELVDELTHRPS
jgi:TPP-dependent indolepyruvate ferredoxin oxidoreductase alpha subunit